MSEVYKAISAVAADLCASGISKDQFNQHQKFRFRGVDDTLAALSPLLVKHGLIMLPSVLKRDVTEREGKNSQGQAKLTIHCVLTVEYRFISIKDDSQTTIVMVGEAADSGDKSHAKSLSIALKYAVFQAFCVPTEGQGHDPDADVVTFDASKESISENAESGGSVQGMGGQSGARNSVGSPATRRRRAAATEQAALPEVEGRLPKQDEPPATEESGKSQLDIIKDLLRETKFDPAPMLEYYAKAYGMDKTELEDLKEADYKSIIFTLKKKLKAKPAQFKGVRE